MRVMGGSQGSRTCCASEHSSLSFFKCHRAVDSVSVPFTRNHTMKGGRKDEGGGGGGGG